MYLHIRHDKRLYTIHIDYIYRTLDCPQNILYVEHDGTEYNVRVADVIFVSDFILQRAHTKCILTAAPFFFNHVYSNI